jgi:hypothetical protein
MDSSDCWLNREHTDSIRVRYFMQSTRITKRFRELKNAEIEAVHRQQHFNQRLQ